MIIKNCEALEKTRGKSIFHREATGGGGSLRAAPKGGEMPA